MTRNCARASVLASGLAALAGVAAARGQCVPSWTTLPAFQGTSSGAVYALAVYDDGSGPALYAAGRFVAGGGVPMNNIAKWTGGAWAPLGLGLTSEVRALAVYDPDDTGPEPASLVAAGRFDGAGGAPALNIARWDGGAWHPLGGGVTTGTSYVSALTVLDRDGAGPEHPLLIAAGRLTAADGQPVNGVAAWNGTSWSALGEGINPQEGAPISIAAYDPDGPGPLPADLYAGGFFSAPTGIYALTRWNGTNWAYVDGLYCCSVFPYVTGMTVYDDDGPGPRPPGLYVCGTFRMPVTNCRSVARWDGTSWEPLAGCIGTVHDETLYSITTFDDDGLGPRLPVLVTHGNQFSNSPPPLPRWDGLTWSSMGYANVRWPEAMTSFDEDGPGPMPPSLFAGARQPGTSWVGVVARYGCPGVPCYANCDLSTSPPILNILDFGCFLNRFAAGDDYANCDASSTPPVLNVLDFACFLNRFAAGCP